MNKELLFTVTLKDCRVDYFRGSGKGGQKRNKTSSGCRVVHEPSGAVGQSDETRSQHQNKRIAFRKMAETKEFIAWHKMEIARRMGRLQQIEDRVDEMMRDANLNVEVFRDGKWNPEAEIAD